MRNKIIVANWKMAPKTTEEAKRIFVATNKHVQKTKNLKLILCSPFTYLYSLAKIKRNSKLNLGVQDISFNHTYAHTGEISGEIVKNMGADYVLVGHSERREMGENNDLIGKKIKEAIDNDLTPILCVGEKERDIDGHYLKFIKEQIISALSSLKKKDLVGLIVAYEPVWAIGKSYKDAMNATDIHEMVLFTKKVLSESFGRDIANSAKILYGGSVELLNVEQIMSIGNVDGLLVGHTSLDTNEFGEILKIVDSLK